MFFATSELTPSKKLNRYLSQKSKAYNMNYRAQTVLCTSLHKEPTYSGNSVTSLPHLESLFSEDT